MIFTSRVLNNFKKTWLGDFGSAKFNRKPRPNYFLAVRINNQQVMLISSYLV